MASSFGVLLVLLGGLAMTVGYEMISDCSKNFINCWDPKNLGAFGFYLGAILGIMGVVILGAGPITRLLQIVGGWIRS